MRGLKEDDEEEDLVPNTLYPRGFFPYLDYDCRTGKNRSDELIRILYVILRWDLGE